MLKLQISLLIILSYQYTTYVVKYGKIHYLIGKYIFNNKKKCDYNLWRSTILLITTTLIAAPNDVEEVILGHGSGSSFSATSTK